MPQEPEEIVHQIAVERERLQQHLLELHDKVEEATDWHTYTPENPILWAAVAVAGLGLLFIIFGRRSS